MLRLNSRRTPKPSGKKKKRHNLDENDVLEQEVDDELKRDKSGIPEFVTDFKSSNLQGVAYDPEKKTMWIRFNNGAIYQYWNVPLNVYRNFWKASSKGKYFWAKMRRNMSIPYKKLTSSLRFIPVSNMGMKRSEVIQNFDLLQLHAAKNNVTLYNKIKAAIKNMIFQLHRLACPGFENLESVDVRFAGNYIDVYTTSCELWINYSEGAFYVTIFSKSRGDKRTPLAVFSCPAEGFGLDAANEIFAYLESY